MPIIWISFCETNFGISRCVRAKISTENYITQFNASLIKSRKKTRSFYLNFDWSKKWEYEGFGFLPTGGRETPNFFFFATQNFQEPSGVTFLKTCTITLARTSEMIDKRESSKSTNWKPEIKKNTESSRQLWKKI